MTPQTHRQALPEGFMLQEYQLGRVLGQGGFGLTYLGWDTALDKAVAVKEYLPNELAVREANHSVAAKSGGDEDNFRWGLNRFLEEARTLARFKHPNIVPVYRCFEAHGTAYIVMEFVEGETLGDYLKRAGRPKESFLRDILTALLDGLAEVHRAGFMHRDIKPGNIILNTEGAPVLVDFGSARQEIGGKSRSITSVVTPGYAPIEQYSTRGNQGPWTDIYALGAVAYRAITGKAPPDATERVRGDDMTPATDAARDDYSAALLRAVDWALAVDEDKRPQDVDAWRGALAGEAHAEKSAAVKPEIKRKSEKKKSSGWAWAAAVAGVLIVGGLVAEWDGKRRQEAEMARQEAAAEAREQAAEEKRRAEAAAKREVERLAREEAARQKQIEEERQRAAAEAEQQRRAEEAARQAEVARQKQIEERRQRATAEAEQRRAAEVARKRLDAAIARLTPKCKEPTKPGDANCWLKVSNRLDCYVWTWISPQSNTSVEWSGRCHNGMAEGHGEEILRWKRFWGLGRFKSSRSTGSYLNGVKQGRWIHH